jgi:hypothetical protein
MVNDFFRKYPWFPLWAMLGVMAACLSFIVYLIAFDPVPFWEVYASPVAHDGTSIDRDHLRPLESVQPGDFFYTYREYCLTHTTQRMYLRRWMEGTQGANKDVIFAYELQLIIPIASVKGCHTISLPIEAPAIISGEYLLHSQMLVTTNILRTDLVPLTDVKVTIKGQNIRQKIETQAEELRKMSVFRELVTDWMDRIDKRLVAINGQIILHREIQGDRKH